MAMNGGSRMKKPCEHCQRYLDRLDEKNKTMNCFLRHMTANPKHGMVNFPVFDVLLFIPCLFHILDENKFGFRKWKL